MKIFSMHKIWIRVPLIELLLMFHKIMITHNHIICQLEEGVKLMTKEAFRIGLKVGDQKRNTQKIYHSPISV